MISLPLAETRGMRRRPGLGLEFQLRFTDASLRCHPFTARMNK
jgi:hypothetical protein